MKSKATGNATSNVEVTNISAHGIWLIVYEKEHFLPYSGFPWFRNAKVVDILNVVLLHGSHLHWPDLDVDLDVDCLDHVESYPLVYR